MGTPSTCTVVLPSTRSAPVQLFWVRRGQAESRYRNCVKPLQSAEASVIRPQRQ